MFRPRPAIVVASLICATVLPGAPGPAASQARQPSAVSAVARDVPVPQGFVGVVVDQPVWPNPAVDLAAQLGVMVASGVQSVRVAFDWSQAQPYASWADVPASEKSRFMDARGVPTDFTALDELVGLASRRGLTLLPTIIDAPSWDGQRYPGGTVALPRSAGPYAAFAAALVRRYGPGGSFWTHYPYRPKVPITMWQIWNEPNITAFWPAQPYYSRYVTLLRAAHHAIKGADPHARVVLAGLPNYSWIELARLYRIPGTRGLFDVAAVHPYTREPQGVITIASYVRHTMDEAGDRQKPILIDETSWPSSQGHTSQNLGYDFTTTPSGQARRIGELLPLLVRNRRSLGLLGFYYYDWAGDERTNGIAFEFSGLFRFSDGEFVAKPAYTVFRRRTLAMEGCRAKGPLATSCER